MGGITTTLFQRPRDPNFNQTTLLLSGNFPTNGAQNNTFLDSSSNNFSITRNPSTGPNAPTQGTFTPFSLQPGAWSNFFGGTGSYASTSNTIIATTTTTFTIEGWIYPTAAPVTASSIPSLISDGAPTGTALYWGFGPLANGTLSFYWYDGVAKSAVGNTVIALNTWTHIAVSVNANAITLYVNGVQQTLTGTTTLTNRSGTTGLCTFAQFNSGGSYFTGYISNFSILSGTAKYSTSFTPSPAPLPTGTTNQVLLFAYANRFVDSNTATTAKTFTITGTPSVQPFSPFVPSGAYTTTAVGGSGYFDGTGDGLAFTNNSSTDLGTGDFTFEAWVYHTNVQLYEMYFAASSTVNDYFALKRTATNTFGLNAYNGTQDVSSSGVTAYGNQWVHVAFVRSGTNINFYINGAAAGSGAFSTAMGTNTGTAQIGKNPNYPTQSEYPVVGYMTNIRMIKGQALTTGAFTPPTAPVTATSVGWTGSNVASSITGTVSLLLNFTNAGIFDSTAKNVLETVGNAQISTAVSRFGGSSMYFDGTGDYLQTAPSQLFNVGASDFTIEFWIYPTSFAATSYPIYSASARAKADCIALETNTSGVINAYVTASGGAAWSIVTAGNVGTLTLNTWNHVALVRNGSAFRGYVNGVQGGMTTSSSSAVASFDGWNIGFNGASAYFTGYIDDLRITRFARYTAAFNVPTIGFTDR